MATEESETVKSVESDSSDLEALKETAKEKLAKAVNGDGNGEKISNGHDNGDSKDAEEELETAEDEEEEIMDEEEDEVGEEEEEDEEDEDEDEEEVQEVKEDSDSDVMEVEAEDPLKSSSNKSSALTSTEVKKPQVVTIDDPKALQALASSAAKSKPKTDKDKVTYIDTNALISGRSTSGVTITPAAKSSSSSTSSSNNSALPAALASSLAASGVTISSKNQSGTTAVPGSNFVYDSKGQLQDPNLTDDTVVIEAPSFIVPYVYEKPPLETFEAFKADIKKLMAELKAKAKDDPDNEDKEGDENKEKKKKKKKRKKKTEKSDKNGSGEEDNGEREDDDDFEEEDESMDSDDSDVVEVANKKRASSPELPALKKPNENFFESTLGKMVSDLGMNLVQEAVQVDLLRQQQRKARKDKSAAVMHAIMSLKQNIEQSKENNAAFQYEEKKCRYCSFRTESELALEHHLETPHMRHGLYRCNFCHYETKSPQEVMGHMQGFHEVKARLERAPALHQCPQCPFEDMMKGKLTRHKVGCDKRFRAERNQEPPHDWEPPAKIPKPPQYGNQVRPGVSLLNSQGRNQGAAAAAAAGVRGALQQFNQQKQPHHNLYSNMPALQFGPGRRPNFSKPFIPNKGQRQMNLPAFGQVGRLAGNPSVTIQSISKTGGFKSNNPSISITPVSGNRNSPVASGGLKPGAPVTAGGGKDNFVICEICDGYIRDLEQLRNHMQFIHKVKIHPKMIHNRPPLNCQKCQFRFFTDQGLERHLLGSHGLVTASMQDLANKGQDNGRCPVCGKNFQWKLLNHVAKDHMKTLKPAHLSYKCTVCTATFGQYKLFENHVYSAHSGGRKMASKPQSKPPSVAGRPLKVSDEITIIPQGKNTQPRKPLLKPPPKAASAPKAVSKPKAANDPDIIEIDDEEEEIDDVEEEGEKKRNGNSSPGKRKSEDASKNEPNAKKPSSDNSAAEESGEEGIEEIRDDDEVDDD